MMQNQQMMQMTQMANAPIAAAPSLSAQAITAGPQDYNALLQRLQIDAAIAMQQQYPVQMLPPAGQMQYAPPQMQMTGPAQ